MHSQLLINGIVVGAGYGLVALSFGLICSTAGFFHLAHSAVYTAAAYTAFVLVAELSIPAPLAISATILGAIAFGAAIEFFIYRPLHRMGSGPTVLLLSSLGVLVVVQNVVSMACGDSTQTLRSQAVTEGHTVLGARITTVQVETLAAGVLLTVLLSVWLRWSGSGKLLRAVACDEDLSTLVGVRTNRVILLAFAIGSGICALAATLSAYDTDLTPMMGFRALLAGIVAAIVGGLSSPLGAFLGGLFVGLVQNYAAWWLPGQWQDTTVFAILILFLLVRPQGFFGKPLRKAAL